MAFKLGFKLSLKEWSALLLVPLLLCIAIVFVVNRQPWYRLEVTVVMKQSPLMFKKGAFQGLRNLDKSLRRAMVGQFRQQQSESLFSFQTKLATLESRAFLAAFIEEKRLKPLLFNKRWDPVAKRWVRQISPLGAVMRLFRNNKEIKEPLEPSIGKAVKALETALKVKPDKQRNVLNISLLWHDEPEVGRDLINAFIPYANRYIAQKEKMTTEALEAALTAKADNESNPMIRSILLANQQFLKGELLTQNEQLSPAFWVLDWAVVPESPYLKVPVLPLLFFGFFFGLLTFCVIIFRRSRELVLGRNQVTA